MLSMCNILHFVTEQHRNVFVWIIGIAGMSNIYHLAEKLINKSGLHQVLQKIELDVY